MEFKLGAKVNAADDQQVGTLAYIVIDPEKRQVTHLVVRKGLLFTRDEVIPINAVGNAEGDRINLLQTARDLEQYPQFEVSQLVETEPEGAMHESSPVLIGSISAGSAPMPAGPRYINRMVRNIPIESIALKEGAKVITSDDRHAGNVDRLITQVEEEHRISHLVVSQGLVLRKWSLVPADWISNLQDSEIDLAVDAQRFDSLPEYEPLL